EHDRSLRGVHLPHGNVAPGVLLARLLPQQLGDLLQDVGRTDDLGAVDVQLLLDALRDVVGELRTQADAHERARQDAAAEGELAVVLADDPYLEGPLRLRLVPEARGAAVPGLHGRGDPPAQREAGEAVVALRPVALRDQPRDGVRVL